MFSTQVFKNALLVTICLILNAILGFCAQLVFASTFGASAPMDVYFRVFSIPAVITGIAPVIFASVVIPALAVIKSESGDLVDSISTLGSVIFWLAAIFVAIGFGLTSLNIDLMVPSGSAELKEQALHVAVLVWIGSGFMIVSGYFSAVLNYRREFFKAAWTSVLPSFFMILCVLLLSDEFGVRSIALGLCAALMVQFFVLQNAADLKIKLLRLRISDIPNKGKFLSRSGLVALSLLPFTILAPIGFYWAATLDAGSVSYLGYSQSIAGFLSVVFSLGIAAVSLPELADEFVKEKRSLAFRGFERSLRYVLLLGMLGAGSLIVLRVPLLSLFYQRGLFDQNSVSDLASVLPWYLIAAVFSGGLNVFRNLFYSRQEYKNIAILGVITPILFVIVAGLLSQVFSFIGIGIANAIVLMVLFCSYVYMARAVEPEFLASKFIHFFMRSFLSVLVSVILVSLCITNLLESFSLVVVSIIGLALFAAVYFFCAVLIFKVKEVSEIVQFLVKKIVSLRAP